MSYKTGFKNGRLGIGIPSGGGDGNGDPLYPLDINGDIRLTGAIVKADGTIYSSGGGVGVKGLYSVQDSNTGKYKFGVGKSNPVYTLDVSGSLNLDGDIYVNGVSLSSGESTTASQALQTGDDPSWISSVTTDLTSDILAPLNEEFDTLLEIANAVQDICNNNLVINLATKANKASPTFTGTVTIPDLNIGGGKLIREASSNDYGGIKINWNNGYANTGHKKYPVMLESGKAYVNVPWTDNNTTYSVGDGGLTTKNFTAALKTKLDGIATNANNYTYSLPQSSTTTIGGVKMSAPFYVQASTGKINCSNAASGQSGLMGWSDWRKLNHFTTDQNNTSGDGNITMTGNVGIGTTSPYTKLDFGDTGGDIRLSKISVSSGLTNRYIGKYQDGATNPWYCAIKFGGTTVSAEFPWDDDYVEDYISFILYNSEPYVSSPGPNEIMKITGAGNVGIGTTTPVSSLHINCLNDYNDGLYIQAGAYNGADSNGGNFLFQQNQHSSTTSKAFRLEEWSSSHSHKRTVMCWQRYTGNVGVGYHIPSYKLHVNGSAYFSSGGLNGSDDRIKHNEKPITNALSIILKLKPKHYIKTGTKLYDASHNFQLDASGNPLDASGNTLEYIKDYTIETGIIAQEIRNISELKFTVYGKDYEDEEDHPLGVDYNSIHCTHIAATQELYKENQELKTEVATLKSELATIKAHLGI